MTQTFKKIQRRASIPVAIITDCDETSYTRPGITRDYLLGGRALFTVRNIQTDESMTYKVRRTRTEWPKHSGDYRDVYYVSIKGTNENGLRFAYRYIGILNPETGTIKTTAQSAFLPGSREYTTAAWATGVVVTDKLIAPVYRIEHLGKCGRCGKSLPASGIEHVRGVHGSCF